MFSINASYNPRMGSAKSKLSEADRAAQRNLRELWEAKKRTLGLTQEKVGELWGIGQAMVSHYLNGHTKLGVVATLRFSRLLGVRPQDIRPDFEYSDLVPGELTPEAIDLAVMWMSLPSAVQADYKRMIEHLAESGYAQYLANVTSATERAKSAEATGER